MQCISLKSLFKIQILKSFDLSPLPKFSPLPLALQLSPHVAGGAADAGVQHEHPEN